MKYELIHPTTAEWLSQKVNKAIEKGATLLGQPFIDRISPDVQVFCQAVTFSDEKPVAPHLAIAVRLYASLNAIIEIGKRDLSNPKYDGYFNAANMAILDAEYYIPELKKP